MLEPIPLPGAHLRFDPDWLPPPDADRLFAAVLGEIPWEVHRIRLFGRLVDSPRLSCWIGDPGAAYRYSGVLFTPHPWTAAVAELRERVSEACGLRFDSVLANRYRSGRDAMGWHSDAEPELGPHPMIASVSLGAVRRFTLKGRAPAADDPATGAPARLALDLPHGSLLVMAGDTQTNYRHALPRTARQVGERINLTFRQVARV